MCRHMYGGTHSRAVQRTVPALGLRGHEGDVHSLQLRRMSRQPEQLPHARRLYEHLQDYAR